MLAYLCDECVYLVELVEGAEVVAVRAVEEAVTGVVVEGVGLWLGLEYLD